MLSFKQWLEIFGGHTPPKQDPTKMGQGAFGDYHSGDQTDPENPDGKLPPVKKRKMKRRMEAK